MFLTDVFVRRRLSARRSVAARLVSGRDASRFGTPPASSAEAPVMLSR